jgi:putative ABC transport system ATP-binding protein
VSPEGPVVTCSNVSKTYRTQTGAVGALHDLDLAVGAGDVTALVGRSGCGKSTLLRLLAGLDGPDAGAIAVAGHDVVGLRGGALRSYRAGCVTYVAQRAAANLIPHLTLREQLGDGNGSTVDALGLAGRVDARVDQLSGGEQARAALVVALGRRTPVLLLDEPTAELDRGAAHLVAGALQTAAGAGRTIVLATHDADLLELATTTIDLAPPRTLPRAARLTRPSADEPVALSVRGLTKTYAHTVVVDDVSIELRRGELGVLLGRSGSGKSTLLMAAGAWLKPDAGAVDLAGCELRSTPAWDRLGYLAQRFALLPELTVRENVALPLRVARAPGAAAVDALLARLALEEAAARRPAEISIGQQQRTALARALVRSPAVLLADEPTSHQDTESAELVWEALAAAAAAGTACLVATHDETAALRTDSVWRIVDGRIASAGSDR